MKKAYFLILFIILYLFPGYGTELKQDSIIVSLITCWPGSEVYELCGHEAVRVRSADDNGARLDSVWNYGTFDFSQPDFLYRFVKGETDYMLSSYPFAWFMPEYVASGRKVVEQDLNLTQDEAHRFLGMLRTESRPENRVYRYNYVKDNCATRIVDRLDSAAQKRIIYPDSVHYGSFRNEMRAYHKDYPWYQFGIDLCLGSGVDYALRGREEMFVPLEMMRKSDYAHFEDGSPLVSQKRVLWDGERDATLGPTAWWLTPVAVSVVLFLISALICWLQWRRKSIYRTVYSVWFGVLGIAGIMVAYLVFISEHEATSPNMNLLWINPLQLVIAIGVWFSRRWRAATIAMACCNVILLTVLLIVWPFQTQSANPAFFLMMATTLVLSVTYAIIATNGGYNNKNNNNIQSYEEAGQLGASRRSGHAKRGGASKPRMSKTRGGNRR